MQKSTSINLDAMGLEQLKSLHATLGERIARAERHQARDRIIEIARANGLSVQFSDAMKTPLPSTPAPVAASNGNGKGNGNGHVKKARKAKGAKRPVPAKYRNPDNHAETWSGRGRQPRWLAPLTKSGRELTEFQISR